MIIDVIVVAYDPTWPQHFDYLRSHPEGVRQYGMMKRELARTFAADRDGYVNGKSDFILAALE